VSQPSSTSGTYNIQLKEYRQSKFCGTTIYPSMNCGGILVCEEQTDERIIFQERIEYGKNRFIDSGTVFLTKIGQEKSEWQWNYSDGSFVAGAVLCREPVTNSPENIVNVHRLLGTTTNKTVNQLSGIAFDITNRDGATFTAEGKFDSVSLFGRVKSQGKCVDCLSDSDVCYTFSGDLLLGDDRSGIPSGTRPPFTMDVHLNDKKYQR